MRALTIVLAVLLIASVATADKKPSGVPAPSGSRALDCTNAIPINCGDVLAGDNTGMPNNVVNYSCTTWDENGGEVVYELVIPAGVCYEVTVTLATDGCDLDVFLLGSCDENECITYGSIGFTSACLEPGTYYIVVDGYGSTPPGAECPFELAVTCVECACPVPECCPFEYTIHLVDFNLDDGAHWLLPCGGLPVWEWGPLTNPDVPDVACDEVPVTNVLGTIIAGDYPGGGGEIAAVGPFFIDQYCTCLELCHYYDTEATFDGCNLKVSTDDGATWVILTPSRGYDQALNTSPMCIPSEQAFSGHQHQGSTTFLRDCFGLADFVGMEIIVGFFFGSDGSVNYPGWYIKWLKIGSDDYSPVENSSWGNIKAMYR